MIGKIMTKSFKFEKLAGHDLFFNNWFCLMSLNSSIQKRGLNCIDHHFLFWCWHLVKDQFWIYVWLRAFRAILLIDFYVWLFFEPLWNNIYNSFRFSPFFNAMVWGLFKSFIFKQAFNNFCFVFKTFPEFLWKF